MALSTCINISPSSSNGSSTDGVDMAPGRTMNGAVAARYDGDGNTGTDARHPILLLESSDEDSVEGREESTKGGGKYEIKKEKVPIVVSLLESDEEALSPDLEDTKLPAVAAAAVTGGERGDDDNISSLSDSVSQKSERKKPAKDSQEGQVAAMEDTAVAFATAAIPNFGGGERDTDDISSLSVSDSVGQESTRKRKANASEDRQAMVSSHGCEERDNDGVNSSVAKFATGSFIDYIAGKGSYGQVQVRDSRKSKSGYFEYKVDWAGQSSAHYNEMWYPEANFRLLSKRARASFKPTNVSRKRECTIAAEPCNSRDIAAAMKRTEEALLSLPCTFKEGVVQEALEKVGYPFGLETVLNFIQERREHWVPAKFPDDEYKVGDKVKRVFTMRLDSNGSSVSCEPYYAEGRIESVDVCKAGDKMYRVIYDDGDFEDLYPKQLRLPDKRRGMRQFHFLELFSGEGVLSKAFKQVGFTVQSLDIVAKDSAVSPPTLHMDMNHFRPETHLTAVPDAVHISLPCETYSKLGGDIHRVVHDNGIKNRNLNISPEAREHDFLFVKVIQDLVWTKKRNPHVAITIENPKGKLRHMPLMVRTAARNIRRKHCCSNFVRLCTCNPRNSSRSVSIFRGPKYATVRLDILRRSQQISGQTMPLCAII